MPAALWCQARIAVGDVSLLVYIKARTAHGPRPLSAFSGRAGGPRRWCNNWKTICPSCYRSTKSPRYLWPKLRTTNVIERCFVEVRGATTHPPDGLLCECPERGPYHCTRSFTTSTWSGEPAPSALLDVTSRWPRLGGKWVDCRPLPCPVCGSSKLLPAPGRWRDRPAAISRQN